MSGNQKKMEEIHRTTCSRTPTLVYADNCLTQSEDNNHDEINYPDTFPDIHTKNVMKIQYLNIFCLPIME